MTLAIFHQHSTDSLLDGMPHADEIVKNAKKLGYSMIGLSDHGVISGLPKFWDAGKKQKMPVALGIELYISHQPAYIKEKTNFTTHMVAWAKNLAGWKTLIKLVSKTNDEEYFYRRPRIHLYTDSNGIGFDHFSKDGNLFFMSGHHGSHLSDNLFADLYAEDRVKAKEDLKRAYNQYRTPESKDPEFYRQFLKPNWFDSTCELALKMKAISGGDNFRIELQNALNPSDPLALWIHPLMVECLRAVSKATGIKAMPQTDAHYLTPEQAVDHRAMVTINLKKTETEVQEALDNDDAESDIMVFFGSQQFYMHSRSELETKFTKEELDNTLEVAGLIEQYDITMPPSIPIVDLKTIEVSESQERFYKACKSPADRVLMYDCLESINRLQPWDGKFWKIAKKTPISKLEYWNRLNEELTTMFNVGLSPYFLLVDDVCKAMDFRPKNHDFDWKLNLKNNGLLDPIARGVGRGSAAGCLISYLINITKIDPLPFGLSFARFYNAGRNTKDRISLPDIDLDLASSGRDWVIEYVKQKYGPKRVSQVITFSKMQGRASVKDIFRIKGIENGYDIANEICGFIPDEAAIADELQEARDAGDEDYGIISWCLDNSKGFQDAYNDPKLQPILQQAQRLEGIKRGSGKHPSGIVITPCDAEDMLPLVWDVKTKRKIIGFDYTDAEKLGAGLKLDILGVSVLDKLAMIERLVNEKRSKITNKELINV